MGVLEHRFLRQILRQPLAGAASDQEGFDSGREMTEKPLKGLPVTVFGDRLDQGRRIVACLDHRPTMPSKAAAHQP